VLTLVAGLVLVAVVRWSAGGAARCGTAASRLTLAAVGGGGLVAMAVASLAAGAGVAALVAMLAAVALAGPLVGGPLRAPAAGRARAILGAWIPRAHPVSPVTARPSSRRFSSPPAG
jgi:hypothetical protein